MNKQLIKIKMEEHGIDRNRIIKDFGVDKSSLSTLLSEKPGARKLTKAWKAAFRYYFLYLDEL